MGLMEEIVSPDVSAGSGLDALRHAAGWMPLNDTGWIAITGGDRVRWLNGMVTNSVQALTPGEGAYTFLLNAQGRIQGDGTVWCEADRLLLQTGKGQVEPMMALLDRFIIMDDVELQDVTSSMHGVVVAGPEAVASLGRAGLAAKPSRMLKRTSLPWRDGRLTTINAYSPLVPRFEVWSSDEALFSEFLSALASVAAAAKPGDFELLRLLEGTPRFGVDIRDRDLPQETAQTRALHFNKGCYLGQEIVERIRSRGQVHRTFTQFRLRGEAPAAGVELIAEGKPAGTLTSVAAQLVDGERLALGYVRREALERGLPLSFAGGIAEARSALGASNTQSD